MKQVGNSSLSEYATAREKFGEFKSWDNKDVRYLLDELLSGHRKMANSDSHSLAHYGLSIAVTNYLSDDLRMNLSMTLLNICTLALHCQEYLNIDERRLKIFSAIESAIRPHIEYLSSGLPNAANDHDLTFLFPTVIN